MITNEESNKEIPSLTDEQRTRLEEWLRTHPYGDQDENGIDLSLIRKNRKLTPAERLAQLQRAHDAFVRIDHDRT
jgi:hypothetical protein